MPDYIAVDVGGTKIAAAIVDESGQVRGHVKRATPAGGTEPVLAAIFGVIDELRAGASIAAIGIGAPGVVDSTSGVVLYNGDTLPWWTGTRLGPRVAEHTGLPVAVENDVRAFAFAEAQSGAGCAFDDVLHVAVGTGVGGAFTSGGEIVRRAHRTTGELAHLLVPATGDIPCGCGRFDHIEAIASGPAITASYHVAAGATVGASENLDLPAIATRAASGDETAAGVIRRAATLLGRALAGLVNAVDVDAVVVGGGVAQIGEGFLRPVSEAFASDLLPPLREVPVIGARHGTDAQLIGMALLASRRALGDVAKAPHIG